MTKRGLLLLTLLILTVSLSGCWDRREVENLGLVQALGIDLSSDGNGVKVSTMIAIPPKITTGGGQGGGGGEGAGTFLISMEGPSIYEAFNKINTTVNREVTLLQNSVIIIGESMARKGVSRWVDTLVRYREMRRTVLIYIAKESAASIMQVQPKLEKNPTEYFRDLASLSKRNGMFAVTTLNDFMNRYEAFAQENYAPYLAKYQRETGENPGSQPGKAGGASPTGGKPEPGGKNEPKDVRCIGTAIFKGDKMVGSFDNYESQVLLLLINQFNEAMLTMADPLKKNSGIVFRLMGKNPTKIRYRRVNSQNHFNAIVKLEADLVSIQSGIDYTRPEKEALLGKKVAAVLEHRIKKVIDKAQNQYQSDVFNFGSKVRGTFLTATEWDRYHWPDKFPQAKIAVHVRVDIRRVGVQFQPPQLR